MKKFTSIFLLMCIALCTVMISCGKKSEAASETPAQLLCKEFINSAENSSIDEIAQKLASADCLPFRAVTETVGQGYLNGFTAEINGFSDARFFGPMIGAIPFIGYVFETDSPDELISVLKDKADLRWNICTAADEMVTVSVKNKVFFVMAPLTFDEE